MSLVKILVLLLLIVTTISILSLIVRDFKSNKSNKKKGNAGELVLKEKLLQLFPNGKVLHNLVVDLGGGKYSQIDFVVVDTTGLYVIECKNYNCIEVIGGIDSTSWSVRYTNKTYSTYSPLAQNYKHSTVIADILNINISDIISSVVFVKDIKLSINGLIDSSVVTMSNIDSIKSMYKPLSEDMVLRISKALSMFIEPSKKIQRKQVKYAKKYA